jgi:hypothetical protein
MQVILDMIIHLSNKNFSICKLAVNMEIMQW